MFESVPGGFARTRLEQAMYVIVASMPRAGCHVGCRWERWRHFLGGSKSASWIAIFRGAAVGRW